jgi:phosphoenolpyruvate phosphomutase
MNGADPSATGALEPRASAPSGRDRFRAMLSRDAPALVAGAHDALSARLVEQSGFDAVWVSSLCVSAALKALPDANLISCTDMAEVTRNITARVSMPVLVDAETGYGDANNAALAAANLERAGAAGLCLEDNAFPKRNSFYDMPRSLVSPEEMQDKVAAVGKVLGGRLLVIARTETLIAGGGPDEALRRGYCYEEAGADALVVHAHRWDEARTVALGWKGRLPLVVIPTRFLDVTVNEFWEAGFRMVIYANLALRAAVTAMTTTLAQVRDGQAGSLDSQVASLSCLEEIMSVRDLLGVQR